MNLNVEVLMQYVTYFLIAIGVLACIASGITQAIKEMPGLKKIQTNVVAMAVSMIICVLAVIVLCLILEIKVLWYYIVAAVIIGFFVYLIATGGWDRVKQIHERTKFTKELGGK